MADERPQNLLSPDSRGQQRRRRIAVVPAGFADDVSLFENKPGGSPCALLTITDVARLLAISASGVRRLQQGRDIPFVKVRGSVRFFEEDVTSYLRRQRVEPIG